MSDLDALLDDEQRKFYAPALSVDTLALVDDAIASSTPETAQAATADAGSGDPSIAAYKKARAEFGTDIDPTTGARRSTSKLVSAAPSWYQGGPPPGQSVVGSIAQGLGQGAQKNADLAASNPHMTLRNKMGYQRRANLGALLGNVVGAIANKPQADYEANQAAALKDAQMQKLTRDAQNGSRGAQDREFERYLGYQNLQERQKGNQRLEEAAQSKAQRDAAMNSASGDLAKQYQDIALQNGWFGGDERVIRQMTPNQITTGRTGAMQVQAIDARGQESDRTFAKQRALHAEQKEAEQGIQIDKEKRAEQQRQDEYRIPGVNWGGGKAPNPKSAGEVPGILKTRATLVDGAKRMQEIQDELDAGKNAVTQMGGNLAAYVAPQRQQDLLTEARLLQQKMVTAAREDDHLGVLQQFEKAMEDAVNPQAGTLEGFLKGRGAWKATADLYDKRGREELHRRNAWLPDEPMPDMPASPLDAPTEKQIRRQPRSAVPAYQGVPTARGRSGGGADLMSGSGAQPVPGEDTEPPKFYKVTFKNKSGKVQTVVRQLDEAGLEKAGKFADDIEEVQ